MSLFISIQSVFVKNCVCVHIYMCRCVLFCVYAVAAQATGHHSDLVVEVIWVGGRVGVSVSGAERPKDVGGGAG